MQIALTGVRTNSSPAAGTTLYPSLCRVLTGSRRRSVRRGRDACVSPPEVATHWRLAATTRSAIG
jgi:hypothetical protein